MRRVFQALLQVQLYEAKLDIRNELLGEVLVAILDFQHEPGECHDLDDDKAELVDVHPGLQTAPDYFSMLVRHVLLPHMPRISCLFVDEGVVVEGGLWPGED